MFQPTGELVGEITMVTNVELAKEVTEQKEKNRLLEETLEAMRQRLDEVAVKVARSEDKAKP
jgi:hypothetical protein